jgi:hypothetical protein
MNRKTVLATACVVVILLLAASAGAIMTVCTECYMVTLPWEPGPQGICLDLQPDGWNFCFDGSPGQWCLHANYECYNDDPTPLPEL